MSADKKLPVTGEIGSEGGSYGNSTVQVAEFEGDIATTAQAVEPDTADAETADAIKPPDEP